VIEALEGSGLVSDRTTLAAEVEKVRQSDDAQGIRLYILMSAFAGLIALIGLVSSIVGQRREREREAAGLRTAGVRAAIIATALRFEAVWLAVGTFVAVAVAGWVGARTTIAGLDLVPQTDTQPPVVVEPNLALVVVTAAAAAIVVGIVTVALNQVVTRRSPPTMLRESVNG
jgi:predicted lysophospholipase L1 biosynthesis ABC-type transport system permease subunit